MKGTSRSKLLLNWLGFRRIFLNLALFNVQTERYKKSCEVREENCRKKNPGRTGEILPNFLCFYCYFKTIIRDKCLKQVKKVIEI